MKYIHHIYITVFVKQDEKENIILEELKKFLPENIEKEKISIKEETATINDFETMKILRSKLSKDKHTKQFISIIKEKLSEKDLKKLVEEKNRVDEEGNFYFRLSKKKLVDEKLFELTDSGDCFHFKIQIAAYPKSRKNALEIVKKIFE